MISDPESQAEHVRWFYRTHFLFVPEYIRVLWCEMELNLIRESIGKPTVDIKSTLEYNLLSKRRDVACQM